MKSTTIKQIYNEFTQEIDATGSSYRKVQATLKRMRDEAGVKLQVKLNQSMSDLECELDRIHRELEEDDKPEVTNTTTDVVQETKFTPEYVAILRERIRRENEETRQLIRDFRESIREVDQAARRCMGFAFAAGGLVAGLQSQDDEDSNQYLPSNEPTLLNTPTTGEDNEQQPISTTTSQPTELDGDGPTTSDEQGGTSDMVHPVSDERGRDSQRTESTTDRAAFNRILRSMEDPGAVTRRELAEIKRRADENYRRAKENNRKIDESIRGIVTATVRFVATVAGQANTAERSSETTRTPRRVEPETVDIDYKITY